MRRSHEMIPVLACLLTAGSLAQCAQEWSGAFGTTGSPNPVEHGAVFDDGSGPALYSATTYSIGGSLVQKWALPTGWTSLPNPNIDVHTLAVVDWGLGPELLVGGTVQGSPFPPPTVACVQRWTGSGWAPLGTFATIFFGAPDVTALAVFDAGMGPELFAAVSTSSVGPIAKWNGAAWIAATTSIGVGSFNALRVFDDGLGPKLYAAGTLSQGGSTTGIFRVEPTGLVLVGGVFDTAPLALEVFALPVGPALYAAGSFSNAGGVPASRVARLSGGNWQAVSGVSGGSVTCLRSGPGIGAAPFRGWLVHLRGRNRRVAGRRVRRHVVDATRIGRGSHGDFRQRLRSVRQRRRTTAPRPRLLRLRRRCPEPPRGAVERDELEQPVGGTGAGDQRVQPSRIRLIVPSESRGSGAVRGGTVPDRGRRQYRDLDRELVDALLDRLIDSVSSACAAVGTGSTELVVGGSFQSLVGPSGAIYLPHVARWNGTTWVGLGQGLDGNVADLQVFDDGGGPALYAAGSFGASGGTPVGGIAKWDGDWSSVGPVLVPFADALAVFDDGTGPALRLGLQRTQEAVAKWTGSSWVQIGGSFSSTFGTTHLVKTLLVFDDGGALYAAGGFTSVGSAPISGIAKWTGNAWTLVGGGLGSVFQNGLASPVAVCDSGSGPVLVAAGSPSFTTFDLAVLGNATWSLLGIGVDGPFAPSPRSRRFGAPISGSAARSPLSPACRRTASLGSALERRRWRCSSRGAPAARPSCSSRG